MEPSDGVLEAACLVVKLEEIGYRKVKISTPTWVDTDFNGVVSELKLEDSVTFVCYRENGLDPEQKELPRITLILSASGSLLRYQKASCEQAQRDLEKALSTYLL